MTSKAQRAQRTLDVGGAQAQRRLAASVLAWPTLFFRVEDLRGCLDAKATAASKTSSEAASWAPATASIQKARRPHARQN